MGADEAVHVKSFHDRDPWLRAWDTLQMSREEARVLSERWTERLSKAVDLDKDQKLVVREVMHDELARQFEHVYDDEGPTPERFRQAWPQTVERVMERCRPAMSEDQAAKLRDGLSRMFQR